MTDYPSTSSDKQPTEAVDVVEETPIAPLSREVLSLPDRPLPPLAEFTPHGRLADDDVVVVLTETAVSQIQTHNQSDTRVELGGVLLGKAYRHGRRIVVEISAALPAHSNDHGPIHFTFTADAWAQVHKDRAAQFPNLSIVGWFHTHPGLGVFYSSDDVVVQSAAFTLPWHVGLVVDPLSKEASFFGWKAGEVVPIGGFYADGARVPWKAVQTAVWDHEYTADDYDQRTNTFEPPEMPDFRAALDTISPKTGLMVGAMGVLLAILLFVFAVVPLNRRANALETAVISLADEALATTNAASCPDPSLRILSPISGNVMAQGSTISIVGTADYPNAIKYLVELRQVDPPGKWESLDSQRYDERLGELATWKTETYGRGVYELRLTAVDRNNLAINPSPCSIAVGLE